MPQPIDDLASKLNQELEDSTNRLAKILQPEFSDGDAQNITNAEWQDMIRRNWGNAQWRDDQRQRVGDVPLFKDAMQAFGLDMPDDATLQAYAQGTPGTPAGPM